MRGNVGVETLIRGSIHAQRVEQERDELPIAADRRQTRVEVVDEAAERRRVHAALLGAPGQIVEQRVDRDVLCVGRAIPFEERGDRLLNSEQPQGEVDERVEFLNFGFEGGDAIRLRVGHGRVKY